ncbi:MAG TPA: DUF2203 domain-containing protein [Ktedonobacterales bacterium]|nr:DUF2203 domain-containing protein [Ktedonobacterales bacterium]
MPTHFTRAEAEALLPRLEPLLIDLRDARAALREAEERLEALLAKMRGNGHAHQADLAELRTRMATLGATLRRGLRRIDHWGVLVKDIETGLIDFPTLRAGHEVYLCWRLGETGIHWWHTIEGGFAARQPLED